MDAGVLSIRMSLEMEQRLPLPVARRRRGSAVLGFVGMLTAGIAVMHEVLSAGYIEEKGYYDTTGATWAFLAITAVPVAAVALWFRFGRLARLVVGILAGYVIWLFVFAFFVSEGP
jgi:hypothetical protein